MDNWAHVAWTFAACAIGVWCVVILAAIFGHAAGQSGKADGVANHKKP